MWNNKEKNPSSISRPSKHKNVRNIHEIPRSVKWKIEKNYASKKNNHIRQYLRDLSIFLRLRSCSDFTIHREKNKRCNITIFSFKTTHQTLISKQQFFYHAHKIHQWAKTIALLSRPKSMEHEFRYMTNLLNLYNLLNIINPKKIKTPKKQYS